MDHCRYCGQELTGTAVRCNNCGQSLESLLYVALPKTFPITAGSCTLHEHSVDLPKRTVEYQEIAGLSYSSQKTSVGLNYLSQADFSEHARLEVLLRDQTRIKVKTADITLTRIAHSVMDLSLLYMLLSDITYGQRFTRYAEEIRSRESFAYDGVEFRTNGVLVTRHGTWLDLREWKIENYGEFFQLSPRNPSLAQKIGKGLRGFHPNAAVWKKRIHGEHTVETTLDRDVFVALMFQLYGIRFPDWRPH